MITVELTADISFIHELMRSPDIYPFIGDDSSPKDPNDLDATHYLADCINLAVLDNDKRVGVFVLSKNGLKVEAHTLLSHECRGKKAVQAIKAAIDWVLLNTQYEEITTYSFSDDPKVSWLARFVGMKEISRSIHPVTRNGLTVEKIHFSLLRD